MKKTIALLSILLASAAATAGDRLTGDELKEFFSDKTIVGVHFKSGPLKTYYGADGMVQSQSEKGTQRTGKWWVEEETGKRCVRWKHKPKDLCHYIERNDDGTYTLIHGKKGKKLVEISDSMEGNQL